MNEFLFAPLRGWDVYQQALELAVKPQVTCLTGMSQGHKAHLLAALGRDTGKPLLVVAATEPLAARLTDDLGQLLEGGVAMLPARDVSFYHTVAASQEMQWRRLETLTKLRTGQLKAVVATADALMFRLMPPKLLDQYLLEIREGQRLRREELVSRLIQAGYRREEMVEGKGQFALRGGILDVFSPDALSAIRVEFFDDEADSIRSFDVLTQRSSERMREVLLGPASEALMDGVIGPAAAQRLRETLGREFDLEAKGEATPQLFEDLPPLPEDDEDELPGLWEMEEAGAPTEIVASPSSTSAWAQEQLTVQMEELDAGRTVHGMERWMHLLYDRDYSLVDYMDAPIVALDEPQTLRERCENRHLEFVEAFKGALLREEAHAAQAELLLDWDQLLPLYSRGSTLVLASFLRTLGGVKPKEILKIEGTPATGYQGQMKELAADVRRWQEAGKKVLLLSGGVAKGQRLSQTLLDLEVMAPFIEERQQPLVPGEVIIAPLKLAHGFFYQQLDFLVLSDTEIYGVTQQKSRARRKAGEKIAAFTDLKVGDYVVHESHGVGIYQGTVRLQSEGKFRDYLLIQYQGTDRLYVPTDQLDRVQKFIGGDKAPPHINRLGGGEWQRQKTRVKASIKELAIDLVKLYAQRQSVKGYAFSPDSPWQREFEENFTFEETPDQLQSITEIKRDMEKTTCMDRLLCGDVGYGKTEVALRAAFKAVMDGKQVAILAPTTILAQQHLKTIEERFAGFPVRYDVLSRFKTHAQQKATLAELAKGDLDILVGTHRILGKDVLFKDLGLLVVDEEQRFGVAHKETIKNLKSSIDVLTLSATPIPRTLHMSMVGIRDMSVLETPPDERYPVQTYVVEYNDGLIRDAILREMARNGQVYFLYNRVASIEQFYTRLTQLVPEARIGIAHGQMREHALEDVMMDYYERKYDVLLCTTIIESGLDVASANTLIVYDADRFGLAQLYQLRGRVGRSNRLAYAYLTVRPNKVLTEDAQKRLDAIREFTEFGSGFRIAMRDLELRGAGNILGPEQSGQMSAVGYDMYVKLIEESVREIRGEMGEAVDVETRVELPVDAYLPQEYVRGEYQRIEMYKRIAGIEDIAGRDDVVEELIDRFGDPPEPVTNLLLIALLKAYCERLQIESVLRKNGQIVLKFAPHAKLDGLKLFQAVHETDPRLSIAAHKVPSLLFKDASLEVLEQVEALNVTLEKILQRLEAAA